MMKRLKHLWQHWWQEPFAWIFYCFFQPLKFQNEITTRNVRKRYNMMCRLALPLYICAAPITILVRFLLSLTIPAVYQDYFPKDISLHTHVPLHVLLAHLQFGSLILDANVGIWLSLIVVIILVSALVPLSLSYAIAGALASCFWAGLAIHSRLGSPGYFALSCCVLGALGLVVGIVFTNAREITQSSGFATGMGSLLGLTFGIVLGFLPGLFAAFLCGTVMYQTTLPLETRSIIGSALSAIVASIFGAIIAVGAIAMVRGLFRTRALLNPGIERGIILGTIACITTSAAIGGIMGTSYAAYDDWMRGINTFLLPNEPAVAIFLACYLLGYYRVPLYPISALSILDTLHKTHRQPMQVFHYLTHSSLYWDEAVYLPLVGLKRILYYALEVDSAETLRVATFIVNERVLQIDQARPVVREIILRDLEAHNTIERIASMHKRLSEMIPQEASLIDPRWQLPFIRLEDASREAASFLIPQGRQARRGALEEMRNNLLRVPTKRAFEDGALNTRLAAIVQCWLNVVAQEFQLLDEAPEELGYIDNPYICGQALQAHMQQFVGRRDLVQLIQRSLAKGFYRPSFLLNGERRMGKTSTLNQLPSLLGSRYLPIVFDLQSRGITANIAVFLIEIAQAIQNAMSARAMSAPPLAYIALDEARRENEAAVYRHMDRWLTQVESILEQEERTILLAFDEFEKLEESGKALHLDLNLLLDWFRTIIQHRSRIALLFSGVKTLNEMETNWPGYFINVTTLRVSYLQPVEAFRLITQPISAYPSEQIFASGVVEEIMRVTGNHPFLTQALCSEIVELLNMHVREQAVLDDVAPAIEALFEHWGDSYFADLWRRTPPPQRDCLHALQHLGSADSRQLQQYMELDEPLVRDTLQSLRRRDLVTLNDGHYTIAAPLYVQWLEHAVRSTSL